MKNKNMIYLLSMFSCILLTACHDEEEAPDMPKNDKEITQEDVYFSQASYIAAVLFNTDSVGNHVPQYGEVLNKQFPKEYSIGTDDKKAAYHFFTQTILPDNPDTIRLSDGTLECRLGSYGSVSYRMSKEPDIYGIIEVKVRELIPGMNKLILMSKVLWPNNDKVYVNAGSVWERNEGNGIKYRYVCVRPCAYGQCGLMITDDWPLYERRLRNGCTVYDLAASHAAFQGLHALYQDYRLTLARAVKEAGLNLHNKRVLRVDADGNSYSEGWPTWLMMNPLAIEYKKYSWGRVHYYDRIHNLIMYDIATGRTWGYGVHDSDDYKLIAYTSIRSREFYSHSFDSDPSGNKEWKLIWDSFGDN